MSVDIGDIVSTGFSRTFKRNGLILVGLTFLVNLYSTFSSQSFITRAMMEFSSMPVKTSQTTLALNLPVFAGGMLYAGAIVISIILSIGTIRTLVSSETGKVPRENFTENILKPFLNLITGAIVFGLAIGIAYAGPALPGYALLLAGIQMPAILLVIVGLLAGLVIGTYVLTSVFFYNYFIIVDDQNFIKAFKSSWNKTEGNRMTLFAAGTIVAVITMATAGLIGFIFGLIGSLTRTVALTTVINLIPQAFVSVFTLAAASEAYRQITA
jgi:uncharacterized membrane protein YedE/YeeE